MRAFHFRYKITADQVKDEEPQEGEEEGDGMPPQLQVILTNMTRGGPKPKNMKTAMVLSETLESAIIFFKATVVHERIESILLYYSDDEGTGRIYVDAPGYLNKE